MINLLAYDLDNASTERYAYINQYLAEQGWTKLLNTTWHWKHSYQFDIDKLANILSWKASLKDKFMLAESEKPFFINLELDK